MVRKAITKLLDTITKKKQNMTLTINHFVTKSNIDMCCFLGLGLMTPNLTKPT